jgi:hypothetical protein
MKLVDHGNPATSPNDIQIPIVRRSPWKATSHDVMELASSLCSELVESTPLKSAKVVVEAEAEDTVMANLVALQETRLGSRIDGIRETLSLLESAMEREPVIAARLMASLYPLAGQALLHEVCDAIDIWIYECHPAELVEAFSRKAEGIASGPMGKKYLEWARVIDNLLARQGM